MAVLALEERARFAGKRIEVASDDVSGERAAEILTDATGRKVHYQRLTLEDARKMSEDWGDMYEWFDRTGYSVDITALKREYPEVPWHTYETWAAEQGWKAILGG